MLIIVSAGYRQCADAREVFADHTRIAVKKPVLATSEPMVIMETSKGTVKILVYRKDAPITAANFIDLVQKGFYDGLTFHRFEPGFVIQGGDPHGDGTGCYIDPRTRTARLIPLEINPGLKHSDAGVVAMARAGDPDSGSCQFYITLAPLSKLDGQYAVFGKVVEGMATVTSLRKNDKIVHAEVREPTAK